MRHRRTATYAGTRRSCHARGTRHLPGSAAHPGSHKNPLPHQRAVEAVGGVVIAKARGKLTGGLLSHFNLLTEKLVRVGVLPDTCNATDADINLGEVILRAAAAATAAGLGLEKSFKRKNEDLHKKYKFAY